MRYFLVLSRFVVLESTTSLKNLLYYRTDGVRVNVINVLYLYRKKERLKYNMPPFITN